MEEPESVPSERPERPEHRRVFTLTQLVIVFAIVSVLWLALDFSRRVVSAQRIQAETARTREQVSYESTRQVELQDELAYAQSDAYVEDWARSDMKMVRPGEHLVIPIFPTPVPAAPAAPEAPPAPPSPWTVWTTLLFGDVGSLSLVP
jgi:cell division protein FtsB